jgi:hypothetical protein
MHALTRTPHQPVPGAPGHSHEGVMMRKKGVPGDEESFDPTDQEMDDEFNDEDGEDELFDDDLDDEEYDDDEEFDDDLDDDESFEGDDDLDDFEDGDDDER